MSAKGQIALMARYHHWATERLLSSITHLPDDLYRKPCGLFFGTIHGTLNHLLLTDGEIWYPRFSEGRSPTDLPPPSGPVGLLVDYAHRRHIRAEV
jgi:uncharacterized damage-inducible protein DinB